MADAIEVCPRCGSLDPARHPAVQFEGEVQICPHAFHAIPAAENCTCSDFVGEDPFCKQHGDRHGHWPVLTWTGNEGGIELADCPKCGGWGEYDARADIVTCQTEDCGYGSRGPTPADAPEVSQ